MVPTLLTWPASVIAWDVKRELWHLTAGFRNGFSYCWRFEPTERMLSTKHLEHEPHPVVAGAAREMMNKADNEVSGVFSTAMSTLGLYRDPVVARATSASDFRIADLMRAGSRSASAMACGRRALPTS